MTGPAMPESYAIDAGRVLQRPRQRVALEDLSMPRLARWWAYVARAKHAPALAGVIAALLLTACAPARSSPAGSSAAADAPHSSPASTAVARAVAPALAQLSTAPVTAVPLAANQGQSIHVLEDPGQFTFGHVGSLTGCKAEDCQGDTMMGRSRMLDAATHKIVGAFLVDCVLIDPGQKLYHCPANTITLTGRGQIVFTETLLWGGGGPGQDTWATWTPWPIIGGTGEFLGAAGTVDSPTDSAWSAGDFVIAFAR